MKIYSPKTHDAYLSRSPVFSNIRILPRDQQGGHMRSDFYHSGISMMVHNRDLGGIWIDNMICIRMDMNFFKQMEPDYYQISKKVSLL